MVNIDDTELQEQINKLFKNNEIENFLIDMMDEDKCKFMCYGIEQINFISNNEFKNALVESINKYPNILKIEDITMIIKEVK